MTVDWRPPHAYVPGRTPRHPEDLFDALKADIDRCPVACLDQTRAWRFGWAFLMEGYYWEAHEVFEAIWMACPPNAPEKLMVQAIIQSANAKLKGTMGRDRAAERLRAEASRLAAEAVRRAGGPVYGIDSLYMH